MFIAFWNFHADEGLYVTSLGGQIIDVKFTIVCIIFYFIVWWLSKCSQVDPIVASFSGGAVGVISALMVVEINNVKQQENKRCKYCLGTGTYFGISHFKMAKF